MRPDFGTLQRSWLEHLAGRGLSGRTLAIQRGWCGRFADFCREEGAGVPASVTARHLARWRLQLERRPKPGGGRLSPATWTQALYCVKQWLTWAHREGSLLVNPARDLVLGVPPHRPRRLLSESEMERLLDQPDGHTPIGLRDRAALELLYSAGLRAGELCALDLADLDLAEGLLWVRRGKGGKDRLLPVGDCLAEALGWYLVQGRPALAQPGSSERALFLSQLGGRLEYQTLAKRLELYVERAGLTGVRRPSLHSLRHSCASHMLRNGAELRQVAEFLGHASVMTTEIYTHLEPLDLVAEHERTHPRKVEKERAGVLLCEENPPGGAA